MRSMVQLHSDRIELRPISRSDAPFIQSLYASPDVTRTLLRIQEPLSSVEAHSFCEAVSMRLVNIASSRPFGRTVSEWV